ncbi:MAG: hypothetical protein GAS50_05505 [Desulfobacterales bacterium]|jgi:hypothetical protein|nr:hypothetical protein [Desulfobacterales bacterium]
MTFPVITIKSYDKLEQLGTKSKFWFYDDSDNVIKLFKIGRPGTGENWSEKASSELAKLLGLPCASYEFAVWEDTQGVVSPIFVPENGRLIHGNELLAKIVDHYPTTKSYKIREYKLTTVLASLKALKNNVSLPIGYYGSDTIKNVSDLFVGYLMFDCWISNPDRHHENWGLVFDGEQKSVHLAPTYDHASGLGCRVSDEECNKRLTTKDTRYSVSAFVARTKSAFFGQGMKQLKIIGAFEVAAKFNKLAGNYWVEQLNNIETENIVQIFHKIPNHLISKSSINFAVKMLHENKNRLLETIGHINNDS